MQQVWRKFRKKLDFSDPEKNIVRKVKKNINKFPTKKVKILPVKEKT